MHSLGPRVDAKHAFVAIGALSLFSALSAPGVVPAEAPASFDKSSGGTAQAFPSKPVRVVVPFLAGGSFDVTSRILAPRMQAGFGQNVIVENRPGGGTVVGTEY